MNANSDIVIPVFDQLAHTTKCVQSIIENTATPYRLIIIDNGSTDGTPAFLAGLDAQVITNGRNLGFAKAVNQGIRQSNAAHVALLNNDTVVPPNWLAPLIEGLEAHPDLGIIGALSTARQVTWTGHYVGKKGIQRCQSLPFSCVVIKREVIEQVGLLDERFFLYCEDRDYCHRAHLAGWVLAVHTGVVVEHEHGATAGPLGLKRVLRDRSDRLLLEKWG